MSTKIESHIFINFLKGYNGNKCEKTWNDDAIKAYNIGKNIKKKNNDFLLGCYDAKNNLQASKSTKHYINGYNCPEYIDWCSTKPKSWKYNENIINIPNLIGKPYRCGITTYCVKNKNTYILLGKSYKGWSLIGGKAFFNEHIQKCAEREFDEETKHLFRNKQLKLKNIHIYDSIHVLFLLKCNYIDLSKFKKINGNISEEEMSELKWVLLSDLNNKRINNVCNYVYGDLKIWKNKKMLEL